MTWASARTTLRGQYAVALRAIAAERGLDLEALTSRAMSRPMVRARADVWLALYGQGHACNAIAGAAGYDPTAVSAAIRKAADRAGIDLPAVLPKFSPSGIEARRREVMAAARKRRAARTIDGKTLAQRHADGASRVEVIADGWSDSIVSAWERDTGLRFRRATPAERAAAISAGTKATHRRRPELAEAKRARLLAAEEKRRAGALAAAKAFAADPKRNPKAALTPDQRKEYDRLQQYGYSSDERFVMVGRPDLIREARASSRAAPLTHAEAETALAAAMAAEAKRSQAAVRAAWAAMEDAA